MEKAPLAGLPRKTVEVEMVEDYHCCDCFIRALINCHPEYQLVTLIILYSLKI